MSNIDKAAKHLKLVFKKHSLEIILGMFVAILAMVVLSPAMANATIDQISRSDKELVKLEIAAMQNATLPFGTFPKAKARVKTRTIKIPITAYASVPEQTDSTPFITASGTRVRDGIVAANFLPIGTRVRIPSLYGDKEFIVEDRMNARYYYKMDIWMADNADAKRFGLRYAEIEILES